jgi:hypothetical protein
MTKQLPVIHITPRVYRLAKYWATRAGKQGTEYSGFGNVEIRDGEIWITDHYIPEQECTAASTEMDDVSKAQLMHALFEQGLDPEMMFACWIHSHPGTGPNATYLSGTDEENITRNLTGGWLISIVVDSSGENHYCRMDMEQHGVRVQQEATVRVGIPALSEEDLGWAKGEFDSKVKKATMVLGASWSKGASWGKAGKGTQTSSSATAWGQDEWSAYDDPWNDWDAGDDAEEEGDSLLSTAVNTEIEKVVRRVQSGGMSPQSGIERLQELGFNEVEAEAEMYAELGFSIEEVG